ncbi:MAG: M14 family zinc carboxypeptidase [Bacteroidota bacterium]
MKNYRAFFVLLFIMPLLLPAQDFAERLYQSFDQYKASTLQKRRIKYADIQPLIDGLRDNPQYRVKKVGKSIEGRDLTLISMGSGDISVFLWSQMHGDEPTATLAIFDMFNFFNSDDFTAEKQNILSKLSLHFIPMLNPDGAEVYQRRNALGIDINRDALRLQSPESRTLKKVRDSVNAAFGFNLHDQSRYYNPKGSSKPATISYLATAFNESKEVNTIRANAMKVIVHMNKVIQRYAPGQVGRYSDDFEPRAFGDNIAKWGTSLILIESGGYPNDFEKQEIRKLNYVSMLSALHAIATDSYSDINLEDYEAIPRNDRRLFDLKIEKATYNLMGEDYILDLGIRRQERDLPGHHDFYFQSHIADQGDLSTFYGYETFNATGYRILPAAMMTVPDHSAITKNTVFEALKAGIGYVTVKTLNRELSFSDYPIHLMANGKKPPESFRLVPWENPTFFLQKEGRFTHAVINGFIIDLAKPLEGQRLGNGLIFK